MLAWMHLMVPGDTSKKFALGLLDAMGEDPLWQPIGEQYEIVRKILGPKLAQGLSRSGGCQNRNYSAKNSK